MPSRAGALLLSSLVAALALAAIPSARASGAASIPPEPGSVILPTGAFGALVADVDGDGRRELVRLARFNGDTGKLAVEIWRLCDRCGRKLVADGTWYLAGQEALRRGASVGERGLRIPRPDANNTLEVLVNDPARLLVWHQAGRERVLAVVNASTSVDEGPPCCLTVWEVTAAPDGGPMMRMLLDTQRGGDEIWSVDMDGDGTDELAVREPVSALDARTIPVSVYRWTGTGFTRQTITVFPGDPAPAILQPMGNTDGLAGDEVGVVGRMDASVSGRSELTRISMRNGRLIEEVTEVPGPGSPLAVPAPDGTSPALLVYGGEAAPLVALRWPAGRPAYEVARSSHRGSPVAVLRSDDLTLIVVQRSGPPTTVEVLLPDLSNLSASGVAASAAAGAFQSTAFRPYVGPWPEPFPDGKPRFVFAGTLVGGPVPGRESSQTPAPERESIAALPAMAPLGLLGPGSSVTALLVGLDGAISAADVLRNGGGLLRGERFAVALAPTTSVLTAEADDGVLRMPLVGALLDPADSSGNGVVSASPTLRATVPAPASSIVQAIAGDPGPIWVLGDASIIPGTRPLPEPYLVPIVGPEGGGRNERFDASLIVITPAGHGYRTTWRVSVVRSAPPLTAEGDVLTLALGTTVRGHTDPTSRVTVDGQAVAVGLDGSFEATIGAILIPRDVQVVATDRLGHRTVQLVSVVGPLDYRRLPWIPIFVLLTVGVGALLFLRSPRVAQRPGAASLDDGVLEEMDPE